MDKRYSDPNSYVVPTRFCCPRHFFNEHEVFSFILARIINPDIELMRGPKYPDFGNHPDWIVCGYDYIKDRREPDMPEPIHAQDIRQGHRYGPFGIVFASHWIGLKQKDIILSETVADIIDDDFVKRIDYNYVYTNMGGLSYTMHSHMVEIFNPFELLGEDPDVADFDYSADEAFLAAADAFQPVFLRQIYWANHIAQERLLVQTAIAHQKSHAVAFDEYVRINLYTAELKNADIRWVILENRADTAVYYLHPDAESADDLRKIQSAIQTLDYIHERDVMHLCAHFKVKSDARHFIRTCNQRLGISTGDLPDF